MFRAMRRQKQQLSEDACIALLRTAPRGVLAVLGDDGYPYAVPLDFVYDSGRLYFHCAVEGHKLDAIRRNDKVSFCVYSEGTHESGDWSLWFQSVIVFGRMQVLTDETERIVRLRQLGQKYDPDPESVERTIEKHAAHALVLVLQVEHMTGKTVHEK